MEKIEKMKQVICKLKALYSVNRSVSQPYYVIFYVLYLVVSMSAFLCNSLLLVSLYHYQKKKKSGFRRASRKSRRHYRKPSRRRYLSEKTRDHLIGYLASFDLLLSVTMPFTAMDVLTRYWPLGYRIEVLAQLMRAAPTALVYSSSMVIILIAYNCYRQILQNTEKQLTPRRTRYIVIVIVAISILVSSPILYFTKLNPLVDDNFKAILDTVNLSYGAGSEVKTTVDQNRSEDGVALNEKESAYQLCKEHDDVDLTQIAFVTDNWPSSEDLSGNVRFYYSIMSLISQSILPFIVISYCYYSVYKRLKRQASIQNRVLITAEAIRKRNEREKRRNKLLSTISLVYLVTWLPLGILGTLSDMKVNFFGTNPETPTIIFMGCNLAGMSSACANPIIYGYRNKHLRKETIGLIKRLLERLQRILKPHRVDSLLFPSDSPSPNIRNQVLTPPKLLPEVRKSFGAEFVSSGPKGVYNSSTKEAETQISNNKKPKKFVSFRSPLKRNINDTYSRIEKNMTTHIRKERSEYTISHVTEIKIIEENGLKLSRSVSL